MSFRSQSSSPKSAFTKWGAFTFRHRGSVLIAWVLLIAVIAGAAITLGGGFKDSFTLPGTESQQAVDVLTERFPSQAGDSATLVIQSAAGVDDGAVRAQIEALITQAAAIPEVASVSSPYDDPSAISADRTVAYVVVTYDKAAMEVTTANATALLDLGDRSSASGFRVEVGGPIAAEAETPGPAATELIGVAAAMVILLITFGSIVAMGLPILSALAGLAAGILGITVSTAFFDMSSFTPGFAAMIGLGVGIDYALFVVSRFREGLSRGLTVEDALVRTVDTAGRAVTFAGASVGIALLGLFVIGIPFVAALGLAAAIVVLFSVLVALTLVPAMLAYIGHRIDRWRIPGLHAVDSDSTNTVWHRWSKTVQRRPGTALAGAALLMLVLAAPIAGLRLGTSDDGNLPDTMHARRAYDLLTEGFGPGFNGPLLLTLVRDGDIDPNTVQNLIAQLNQTSGIAAVGPATYNVTNDAAVISVIPTTAPQDADTVQLVEHLRSDVVPAAVAGTNLHVYIGGATAASVDMGDKISARMPLFFAIVIGLSMLLLTAVFRSIAVPIKAALMNLLSIGATCGVLVAVFQWGWGASLLGIKPGPIESPLPMMLFAILFGLSMDYEVFLLSRMREEYVRTKNNSDSVASGLASTARVIAAAAAIMVVVFGSFIFGGDRLGKEFGLGLAVAILVDATVVRLVLVPATMELLGNWNWWFPTWLDRLTPRLNVEGTAATQPTALPAD